MERGQIFNIILAQENHSQLTIIITDHNPLILIVFAEDHQVEIFHNTIHAIDIADQIFSIISTEVTTLDQILKELITQTIIEIAHIQILGIYKKLCKQPQSKNVK